MRMDTKICSKCGRELPLSEFNKCKRQKDGLQYQCKECQKQYYTDNKEDILAQQKQYKAEHKEEIAEYNKQYNAEHVEERKQYRDEHAEEIKQYKAEYMPKYRAEHAEEIKQWRANYYTEWYATIEGYAYSIRYANLQEDRKRGRCGEDEDILPSLDYYIWALQQPDFYDGKQYHWSEMGLDRIYNDKPHTFANIVPCSTKNNNRRQKMPFEEFRALMQREREEAKIPVGKSIAERI